MFIVNTNLTRMEELEQMLSQVKYLQDTPDPKSTIGLSQTDNTIRRLKDDLKTDLSHGYRPKNSPWRAHASIVIMKVDRILTPGELADIDRSTNIGQRLKCVKRANLSYVIEQFKSAGFKIYAVNGISKSASWNPNTQIETIHYEDKVIYLIVDFC